MNLNIIGYDGTGKTTLAKNLVDQFNQKLKIAEYYRPGQARYNFVLALKVWGNNNRVLICDRGYYDSAIVMMPDFLVKSDIFVRIIFKLMHFFLPGFDKVFLLDASYETICKRKKELTLKEYEKRARLYKLLEKIVPVIRINAELDKAEVEKLVIDEIDYDLLEQKKLSDSGLYGVSHKYSNQKHVIIEEAQRAYKETLKLLQKLNKNFEFVLFKAHKDQAYVGHDIDVLFKNEQDFGNFRKELKQLGWKQKKVSKIKFWDNCNEKYKEIWRYKSKGEFVTVHLHQQISWRGVIYIDKEKVFVNKKKQLVHDIEFDTSSDEDALLIQVAHIIFEVHKLRMIDLLHLIYLLERVDGKKLLKRT